MTSVELEIQKLIWQVENGITLNGFPDAEYHKLLLSMARYLLESNLEKYIEASRNLHNLEVRSRDAT